MKMLNAASEKKLVGVKPALVKLVRRAAELTKQPFQIVQGNRTQAEQNALYAQGRSKAGPIVTWTKNSKHIGGGAVDYAALVGGKISWNEKFYPPVATAFKQAAAELNTPIVWGGDWKKRDWGHIELGGSVPVVAKPVPTPPPPSVPSVPLKPAAVARAYDPMRAVSFFVGRGWSEAAACALVASIVWESGGNGKAKNFTPSGHTIVWDAQGDKINGVYTSFYAPQWNGPRIKAFEKFAREIQRDVLDPYAQLAFIHRELESTEKRAANRLRAAVTIEEANDAAITFWRPSIPHADKRLAIAKKLLAA